VRFVKLPPVGEEESKVKQIVELEAKQNIPFPMEDVIWDYQLIKSTEAEAEIEVVFVVVKNEDVRQLAKIIEDNGLSIELIEVAHTASFNSARANGIGQNECEMILNIGCRCSTLVFIDCGRFFVRPIPIAGYSITQQISKEFGIPFADAEEMKRRHGFVALGGAYEEPDSEVAATVSKIVRNVMTRLHGEINRSINVYRSQQKGKKPSKLWLAGGSSVMAFTPRFFSEKLRIPVDYFNAFQIVALSPEINKESLAEVAHMFSEVIGLGLRHSTVCPIEISLLPNSLRKINELKLKIPYFHATAVSIVLCLGILLWSFQKSQPFIA
jgi:type IV pilus assembly protein PilM